MREIKKMSISVKCICYFDYLCFNIIKSCDELNPNQFNVACREWENKNWRCQSPGTPARIEQHQSKSPRSRWAECLSTKLIRNHTRTREDRHALNEESLPAISLEHIPPTTYHARISTVVRWYLIEWTEVPLKAICRYYCCWELSLRLTRVCTETCT